MGYMMGLHLCDVKFWSLKFLNIVAKPAMLLEQSMKSYAEQPNWSLTIW
jgi:hypothetical protein